MFKKDNEKAVNFLDKVSYGAVFWPTDLLMKIKNPTLRVLVTVLTLPITVPHAFFMMVVIAFPILTVSMVVETFTDIYNGEF